MKPSNEINFKAKGGDEGRIPRGESVNDPNQILVKNSNAYAADNAIMEADNLGHQANKEGGKGCETIPMAALNSEAHAVKCVAANDEDASKRMQ